MDKFRLIKMIKVGERYIPEIEIFYNIIFKKNNEVKNEKAN